MIGNNLAEKIFQEKEDFSKIKSKLIEAGADKKKVQKMGHDELQTVYDMFVRQGMIKEED